MDKILVLSQIILFSVCYILYAIYNIHMFQLEHYIVKEHMKWNIKNKEKLLIKSFPMIIIILALTFGQIGRMIAVVIYIVAVFLNTSKLNKKPLVYTKRVQRIFVSLTIFTTIIVLIQHKISVNGMLFMLPTLVIIMPLILILINYINSPIEKMINKSFINDAKKTIKSMPNLIVIGITGSYGKTSVKNYLYNLLSAKYNVLMTPENYNTTLGVTRTIRQDLRAYHQIFICEMGAFKLGEIKEICDLVHPKYGVITSIGEQHLDSFGSIENIIKTKFELADSLPNDGIVFLNIDNEYIKIKSLELKKSGKKIVTYGVEKNDSDYKGYDISYNNLGLNFKTKLEGKECDLTTKLLGAHNAVNIMGAIAIADKLGVPSGKIISKVKQLESVEHRLQLINRGNLTIIDDAYNSNPSGAASALQVLSTFDGIRILVTPGMIELKDKQYEYNYEFGKQATKAADYIFLVGKKQTEPIFNGIKDAGFNEYNLRVVDSLKQALSEIQNIQTQGRQKIVLLENDLPDNY